MLDWPSPSLPSPTASWFGHDDVISCVVIFSTLMILLEQTRLSAVIAVVAKLFFMTGSDCSGGSLDLDRRTLRLRGRLYGVSAGESFLSEGLPKIIQ